MSIERWIVIPGFMKAGSTSVFSWLEEAYPSPDARPKEPRFFLEDTETQAELDRYWRQSSGGSDTAIDGSVAYLDPGVSSRVAARISAIAANGPAPRFVVVIRDPIARAVSHIRHDMRRGRLRRTDEAGAVALITPGHPYFERSRLATAIEPLVQTFPPQSILIVDAEVADNRKLATIASFLDVPEPMMSESVDRMNQTSVERSYTPALSWIADRGLIDRGERLVPRRMRPLVARALLRPPVDTLDVHVVRGLMSVDHVSQLESERERFEALTAECARPE